MTAGSTITSAAATVTPLYDEDALRSRNRDVVVDEAVARSSNVLRIGALICTLFV